MKGLFVPADRVAEYQQKVAEVGNVPVEVVQTFDNAVLIYDSEERTALARLFHTGGDEEAAKVFGDEEADLVRDLAQPKPKNLDADEYARRYRGYDWLEDQKVITYWRSKAAHKAWTTTRFWESEALAGNFTHDVKITYKVGYQTFVHTDRAVCEAHARSVAKKAIKKIARDLFPAAYGKRTGDKTCPFKARIAELEAKVEVTEAA